jgi:hypothetical protein
LQQINITNDETKDNAIIEPICRENENPITHVMNNKIKYKPKSLDNRKRDYFLNLKIKYNFSSK